MNKSEKIYFSGKINTLSLLIENIQSEQKHNNSNELYSEIAWLENFEKEIKELIK